MESGLFSASPFLPLIGGSVVLLVVHILLQGFAATKELGSRWNAGPRDEGLKPSGKFAGRAERASANFRETYPAFIGLALALVLKGDPSGWGILGAWLWLLGRIVYIWRAFPISVPSSGSSAWWGSVSCFWLWFCDDSLHVKHAQRRKHDASLSFRTCIPDGDLRLRHRFPRR